MGRQYADPERDGANRITDEEPASIVSAAYLNDWLVREIEGFVKRRGIKLSADDLAQFEKAILKFIQDNAISEDQIQQSWDDATDGRLLQPGAFGWGAVGFSSISYGAVDINTLVQSGVCYAFSSSSNSPPGWRGGYILTLPSRVQLAYERDGVKCFIRQNPGSDVDGSDWALFWNANNTTTDTNGALAPASPIFRVATNADDAIKSGFTPAGAGVANQEAEGVTCEHPETGVYIVRGSLGFRRENEWYIKTPIDANHNPKCFVEYDERDDGTIEIRTYKFAADGPFVVAGEPMDIPAGRWIDLRLSMPEPEEPEDQPEDDESEPA